MLSENEASLKIIKPAGSAIHTAICSCGCAWNYHAANEAESLFASGIIACHHVCPALDFSCATSDVGPIHLVGRVH